MLHWGFGYSTCHIVFGSLVGAQAAELCFMRHALMENWNGLVVDACLTSADGR